MNSRNRPSFTVSQVRRDLLQTALYYGLPMLFCLVVHWMALKTWFYGDDFAWLGLRLELHKPGDLVSILFRPEAQGTVRTLSERLFFLAFYSIFGLNPTPFRIWAFLTQFANIFLLIRITRRLTGSSKAGFLAAIFWPANAGLGLALGWSSAYNEICFAFFILLEFYLLLRYIDTGESKYWIWQWVVFVLGFGALELNVMYPLLASGYALCCARDYFRKTLLLFIPSILFTVAHFLLVPAPTDPYYHMYFGFAPFRMLWWYWEWTLTGVRHPAHDWPPVWLGTGTALAITVGLAIFVWRKVREKQRIAVFLLGWFLAVIVPVLPLKNHFTEYYVTVPAIGLAILAAWAVEESRGIALAVAAVLAGLYLVLSISDIQTTDKFDYTLARKVKYMVRGVEAFSKRKPGVKFFLAGVDNNVFWGVLSSGVFRLIGVREIYLVPGAEKGIDPHPEWGGNTQFAPSVDDAVFALKTQHGMVVELDDRTLRDVTGLYLPKLEERLGREIDFVDVADNRYASRLGPGWFPVEGKFRWMGKTGNVQIPRPKKAGQMLKVTGFCPGVVVAQGPVEVTFRSGGVTIGTATLKDANRQFSLNFTVPANLIGSSMMDVQIDVSRSVQVPNDPRTFGLVFGTFTLE